ncbi:MAG: helix-turn-helix transcriptional regulator [Herbiconiux sp.]|nr:helix-turn-helix transcriptional regulator [Herbiconiux sp.]
MTSRSETIAHFLRVRRSSLDPTVLGYPSEGRRVSGLRREELATLAGISVDYYTRIEQGRGHRMSDQVLASLARALDLDDDQRSYFYRLARPTTTSTPDTWEPQPVSETVLALLRANAHQPVHVFDSNQDVIAINEMADFLLPYAMLGDNQLLTTFAVPLHLQHVSENWQQIAQRSVSALRFHGDPEHPRFQEIVNQLLPTSEYFRRYWEEHDARPYTETPAWIGIDGFGAVEFSSVALDIPDGFFMATWTAEPGTTGQEVLEHFRANRVTGRGVRGPLAGWPTTAKR